MEKITSEEFLNSNFRLITIELHEKEKDCHDEALNWESGIIIIKSYDIEISFGWLETSSEGLSLDWRGNGDYQLKITEKFCDKIITNEDGEELDEEDIYLLIKGSLEEEKIDWKSIFTMGRTI